MFPPSPHHCTLFAFVFPLSLYPSPHGERELYSRVYISSPTGRGLRRGAREELCEFFLLYFPYLERGVQEISRVLQFCVFTYKFPDITHHSICIGKKFFIRKSHNGKPIGANIFIPMIVVFLCFFFIMLRTVEFNN